MNPEKVAFGFFICRLELLCFFSTAQQPVGHLDAIAKFHFARLISLYSVRLIEVRIHI